MFRHNGAICRDVCYRYELYGMWSTTNLGLYFKLYCSENK